ncbi:MAG: hypothetical protein K9I47_04840 [Bacteroidales bacterium]|nr:hypothetical protein [Bacteroidales bacterium]
MKKKLFILLTVISLILTSCDSLLKDKTTSSFRFIPTNSPLVFESKDFMSLWDTYSKSSLWDIKENNQGLEKVYKNLQTLQKLTSRYPALNSALSESSVLFSVVNTQQRPALLLVTQSSLTMKELENIVRNDFSNKATFSSSRFMEIPTSKVIFSDQDAIMYIAFKEGNIIATYNQSALEKALEQFLLKKDLTDNQKFSQIRQTSGEYTDGSLYVNFKTLPDLLSSKERVINKALIESIPNTAEWGALDLTAKKNKLIMNGFVSADTGKYLSLFKDTPSYEDFEKILPYQSSIVVTQKFGNHANMVKGLSNWSSSTKKINKISNLRENLLEQINQNILLAITASHPRHISSKTFVYLQTQNPSEAYRELKQLARQLDNNYYNEQYQGYDIIRLSSEDLFADLFGKAFTHFTSPYFTVYKDYLVGCPNKSNLVNLLQQLEDGKSLAQSDVYQSTSSGITAESNIGTYIDINRALKLLPAQHPLNTAIEKNPTFFQNLSGLSLEFTSADKFYFTSVFLNTGEKLRMSGENNWELQLEAKMVGQPHIVDDHLSSEKRIIVFDALNNMYFINHKGKVLWKHMLSGRPLSDVYEVDAYKNNKVQYIFNTESHLYLIDVLGRDVGDFPVKLSTPATNGMALFDYTGHKYYRILVAGTDQKVYNYDIEGKPVTGWKKPAMDGKISQPLQHMVYGNRDYIIITDQKGNVKITNRKGQERISVTESFTKGHNSKFYINRTNSKSPFITTDRKGILTYVNASGTTSETIFDTLSPKHYFFYEKFNKDPHYDFIYFDDNKLTVYDRFKEIVYERNFGEQVITEPRTGTFNGEKAVSFTSLSDERLYLITKDGINEKINRLEGNTPFATDQLKPFGKVSVVVGKEERLYKYVLD